MFNWVEIWENKKNERRLDCFLVLQNRKVEENKNQKRE